MKCVHLNCLLIPIMSFENKLLKETNCFCHKKLSYYIKVTNFEASQKCHIGQNILHQSNCHVIANVQMMGLEPSKPIKIVSPLYNLQLLFLQSTRLRRLQRLQNCSSTQLHRCNSYDYNNGTSMLHYNSSSEDSLYLSTSLLSISCPVP